MANPIIITKPKNAAKSVVITKPKKVIDRVKKVYKLPGQKKDTPPKSDPLYKFYTTLLKQKPDSEMALKWCLEHGALTQKKAEKALMMIDMQKLKI